MLPGRGELLSRRTVQILGYISEIAATPGDYQVSSRPLRNSGSGFLRFSFQGYVAFFLASDVKPVWMSERFFQGIDPVEVYFSLLSTVDKRPTQNLLPSPYLQGDGLRLRTEKLHK